MEGQLRIVLVEMLSSVIAARDFIVAELPEVITQLLVWKSLESILSLLFIIILTPLVWEGRRRFLTSCTENDTIDKMFSALICAVLNVTAVLSLPFLDWVQIWLAPKVYLIEYVTKLGS